MDLSTPYNFNACNHKNRNLLIKSGSFSGCSTKQNYNERHTSSDPSTIECCNQGKYETSTTSGAESEEDLSKRYG